MDGIYIARTNQTERFRPFFRVNVYLKVKTEKKNENLYINKMKQENAKNKKSHKMCQY